MNRQNYTIQNDDLLIAITIKKKEMIELGMKYGLTDRRTVACSQQLDNLLNTACEICEPTDGILNSSPVLKKVM
ncbi:Spo0E family sporulation regulatory protein-aspartic acid phosphatase [Virgibacillus kekensis]|uniref:Spo0E family sporulation regulatory protein-aspartic acid phosphatase n=1 Tax=Virgibacillus kekensis TaxID=202261 RepID=A0ABV9DL29_9BACI